MNQHVQERCEKLSKAVAANVSLGCQLIEKNLHSWLNLNERQDHYKGITPHQTIYSFDTLRVFEYTPAAGKTVEADQTPVLLVPSMINRSYIMDLMEGSSLAGELVNQGLPTYMVDWGEPGPQHDHLTFPYFIDTLLGRSVRAVMRKTGAKKVHLLGYCMAGTMSLMYSALHPDQIASLTLLAAPINFHDDGPLAKWASKEMFKVDDVIEVLEHMDSLMLQSSFLMLKPLSYYQKLKGTYETSSDPRMFNSFVNLERWVNDNTNVPGKSYAEYVKLCYHENSLVKGKFPFGDREIDLSQVTCPIMNVMATKDHIVPVESSRILSKLVSGKVTEMLIDAGHIGIVMGRKAKAMFESLGKFYRQV